MDFYGLKELDPRVREDDGRIGMTGRLDPRIREDDDGTGDEYVEMAS